MTGGSCVSVLSIFACVCESWVFGVVVDYYLVRVCSSFYTEVAKLCVLQCVAVCYCTPYTGEQVVCQLLKCDRRMRERGREREREKEREKKKEKERERERERNRTVARVMCVLVHLLYQIKLLPSANSPTSTPILF